MAEDNAERVRRWIEAKMSDAGMSQTTLARALGIAPSAVSRLLKGERQLTAAEFVDTVRLFGASLDDFKFMMDGYDIKQELPIQRELSNIWEKLGDKKVLKEPSVLNYENIRPFYEGDEWLVPNQIVRSAMLHGTDLRYVSVLDNHMRPFIGKGDTVIIDLEKVDLRIPGIFAIEGGNEEPLIRRIQLQGMSISEHSLVSITAEDPGIDKQTLRLSEINILGRCVAAFSSRAF